MGCWEETCALTNTPIFTGDPCVMVRFNPKELFKYEPERRAFGSWEWDFDAIISIHKGEYNDYGWIEGVEKTRNLDRATFNYKEYLDKYELAAEPVREEYDWDFDFADEPSRHETIIFFHESVWNESVGMVVLENFEDRFSSRKMAKQMRELAEQLPELKDTLDKINTNPQEGSFFELEFFKEFYAVVIVAAKARRDIFSGRMFSGCQEYDNFPYQEMILAETTKQMDIRRAELKEWQRDDEEGQETDVE